MLELLPKVHLLETDLKRWILMLSLIWLIFLINLDYFRESFFCWSVAKKVKLNHPWFNKWKGVNTFIRHCKTDFVFYYFLEWFSHYCPLIFICLLSDVFRESEEGLPVTLRGKIKEEKGKWHTATKKNLKNYLNIRSAGGMNPPKHSVFLSKYQGCTQLCPGVLLPHFLSAFHYSPTPLRQLATTNPIWLNPTQ